MSVIAEIIDTLEYKIEKLFEKSKSLEKNNQVLGLDSSNGMVEEFNKKAKDRNLTNIKAKKHDILNDDLGENCFDLIVISMSLHHIENLDIFFEKSFKALRNGGYLCINDLEKEDGTFHKKHNNEGVFTLDLHKKSLKRFPKKLVFLTLFLK